MSSTYSGSDTFHPTITIPSDGDARDAMSVNVPFEALQDDVVYLKNRLGAFRPVWTLSHIVDETSGSETNAAFGTLVTGVAAYTKMTDLVPNVAVLAGDIVEVTTFAQVFYHPNAGSPIFVRMFTSENGAGSPVADAGAAASISQTADNVDTTKTFCIQSWHTVVTPGALYSSIFGRCPTAGQSVQLVGCLTSVLRVWRAP